MKTFPGPESSTRRGLPIAKEGFPFVALSGFITVYFLALGLGVAALFFFAATCFIVFFFRDPERIIPDEDGVVVSPADGRVLGVDFVDRGEFVSGKMLKISIFMSVFNVHVNRIPADSVVTAISYYSGKFFSANLDKASKDNERNAVFLDIDNGPKIVVVQVAGLIARRIVCKVQKGDHLRRGERFGLIRFGSRLDVYLPPDMKAIVSPGDKVLAGASVLGSLT